MPYDSPAITTEWAKQVAFEAFGPGLDFGNMNVIFVPGGIKEYIAPILKSDIYDWFSDGPSDLPRYEEERITVKTCVWPLFEEEYRVGYGPKSNLLVVTNPKEDA